MCECHEVCISVVQRCKENDTHPQVSVQHIRTGWTSLRHVRVTVSVLLYVFLDIHWICFLSVMTSANSNHKSLVVF